VRRHLTLVGYAATGMAKRRPLADAETTCLGITFVNRIQASRTFTAPIEARSGWGVRCPENFHPAPRI